MGLSKHFVIFYSPGTFTAETTEKPVGSWSVDEAVSMAKEVSERYNAKPYGFRFITKSRGDDELDSHVSAKSGMYYLGGRIETLDEIAARDNPDDATLLSNMRNNGCDRVVVNENSWKWTQPLYEGDVVLDFKFGDRS